MALLKDDGVDPMGGVFYSRYDRVRVEGVWRETLNKERSLREETEARTGRREFSKAFKSVPPVKRDLPSSRAEEIGWLLTHANAAAVRRRETSRLESSADSALAAPSLHMPQTVPTASTPLQHSGSEPALPVPRHGMSGSASTSLLPQMQELNNRRFYRPRSFCPITRYADIYQTQMGCNPFNQGAAGR